MKIKGMTVCEGGLWVAMSLEFGLAAQARSQDEALSKLSAQIEDYIAEANQQDHDFQIQLLQRKAPLAWYVRYYAAWLTQFFRKSGSSPVFSQWFNDFVSHA